MTTQRIDIFGEVLFDQFPDGRQLLGGAPFNVAWHLHAFGQSVDFISRVGNDADGLLIKKTITNWGLSLENVQTDPIYPTGSVRITVIDGEPNYAILPNQAYDFIDSSSITPRNRTQNILYHGSLALRHQVSATTLNHLMQQCSYKLFIDVNLRSPWWQLEHIKQNLNQANWAKLNIDELMQLHVFQHSLRHTMDMFRAAYNLDVLIVTCGEKGAAAINNHNDFFEVTPDDVTHVVDTVGTGDAFSAVMLLGLQYDWPLSLALARAQAFASAMVGQQGALTQDLTLYQSFLYAWQLD